MSEHRTRLIADVDTGIDDACALLYLLGRRRTGAVELAAITTSAGNTTARQAARNTLAVLDSCGVSDVEVAIGSEQPVEVELVTTPETHGMAGLGYAEVGDVEHKISPRGATEVWLEELRAHPGETTLLVTGPLTNLARALRAEPELPSLLGGLVIMGGSFGGHRGNVTPVAEWNSWVDPHAAAEVYRAFAGKPIDRLPVVAGLEVTEQVYLLPAELDDLVEAAGGVPPRLTVDGPRRADRHTDTGRPPLDLLVDALTFYFEFHTDYDTGYFAHLHDLYAAMLATGEVPAEAEPVCVDVEAGSELTRGMTIADVRGQWGRPPTARVVTSADRTAALRCWRDALVALTA